MNSTVQILFPTKSTTLSSSGRQDNQGSSGRRGAVPDIWSPHSRPPSRRGRLSLCPWHSWLVSKLLGYKAGVSAWDSQDGDKEFENPGRRGRPVEACSECDGEVRFGNFKTYNDPFFIYTSCHLIPALWVVEKLFYNHAMIAFDSKRF